MGFPEVEYFYKKQSQHCRVETFRTKRQVKQILLSMKLKLSDAVADLKKLRICKSNVRRGFLKENDKTEARRFRQWPRARFCFILLGHSHSQSITFTRQMLQKKMKILILKHESLMCYFYCDKNNNISHIKHYVKN